MLRVITGFLLNVFILCVDIDPTNRKDRRQFAAIGKVVR